MFILNSAIKIRELSNWAHLSGKQTKLMLLVLDMRDVLVERTLRCADQVMHLGWDDLELVVSVLHPVRRVQSSITFGTLERQGSMGVSVVAVPQFPSSKTVVHQGRHVEQMMRGWLGTFIHMHGCNLLGQHGLRLEVYFVLQIIQAKFLRQKIVCSKGSLSPAVIQIPWEPKD